MYDFLLFLLTIVQFLAVSIVLGIFILLILAGMYILFPSAREVVYTFSNWADRRQFRKDRDAGKYDEMLAYAKADTELMFKSNFGLRVQPEFDSVFDETLDHKGPDYTDLFLKAWDDLDAEPDIIDKSTSFRGDFK